MDFFKNIIYKIYFYCLDSNLFLNFFDKKNITEIKDQIIIKKIKILVNDCVFEKKYLENHINFLNSKFLNKNKSISIKDLLENVENGSVAIGDKIDGIYIIWEFLEKEYITFYDRNLINNKNKINFPVYSSQEYKEILKKQEEMFSNGILMVADEKGNILTDDIIKYSGPLENFKMYSHTDDFPFNKIILDFNKREFLFDKRDLIKITDKELNDIEINMDTNKWVHNQQDCDKHLDNLFKESANHNIENKKIEELASQSSIMDMVYNNYYVKMLGSLYHRAFQQKIKKE